MNGDALHTLDVTAYLEPYHAKVVSRPAAIRLGPHTYSPSDTPQESWIPSTLRAFARLAPRVPVRDLLIVGTGNGLDALGGLEIFDLESVTITDLFDETVSVAAANIRANLRKEAEITIRSFSGDLLSCIPPHLRFCLVYENLPNLPLPETRRLEDGTTSGTFVAPSQRAVPEVFDRHLLALHYLTLTQAREVLRDGGGVLTSIGGRVPLEVVLRLHRDCGYEPELVVFDVKLQSEAEWVLPGFERAEAELGISFIYYAPEAYRLTQRARQAGIEGGDLVDEIQDELAQYAITAREALARHRQGFPVAHSVFMVFGMWKGPGDNGGVPRMTDA